jgi:type VI secretion system protein ImpA
MSVLDLDKLLAEISEDAPCGEDLEYDPAFGELERATEGKPEQQFGETIIPAEDPNWKDVKRLAIELLGRTKDLRAAAHLTRALIRQDGIPGLADGLELIRGYIEKYWDTVHPQLDPDDNNDPTMRVNAVVQLCNPTTEFQAGSTLRFILDAPLVAHRALGVFSLHDIEIANGQLPKPPDVEGSPDPTAIDAAFVEVELEELQGTSDAVKRAIEHAAAVDKTLTEHVGTSDAADLSDLHKLLAQIDKTVGDRLSARGVFTDSAAGAGEEGQAAGQAGPAAATPAPIAGEVRSREDVVRALEKIIEYYVKNEPSSPIPLLLNRAKRLVAKSFMEIVQDLAPTGLPEVQKMGGTEGQ